MAEVDDLTEDNTEDEATEAGLDESSGVRSDAGGLSLVLVLASRLHTGQKVLHVVSQASTQEAWNSVTFTENKVSQNSRK